jgi:hypothetical protein
VLLKTLDSDRDMKHLFLLVQESQEFTHILNYVINRSGRKLREQHKKCIERNWFNVTQKKLIDEQENTKQN